MEDLKKKLFNSSMINAINERHINLPKNFEQKEYISWIPNNSGHIRYNLIGLSKNSKHRIKAYDKLKQPEDIITLDFDNDLEDDIPPIFTITKKNSEKNDSLLEKKLRKHEFGREKSILKPVFLNFIKLVDDISIDNPTPIKADEINNYSNSGYIGKAFFCFFTPNDYVCIKKDETIITLKKYNEGHNIISIEKIIDNLKKFFNGSSTRNNCNVSSPILPVYSISIDYKVEKKGKITLGNTSIYYSPEKNIDVDISSICKKEQLLAQQFYTQIKKIIHGDTHHHYKTDTILKVIESTKFKEQIIIEQFITYIKTLEKVEQNRKKLPCSENIPSFLHDAEGVKSYVDMYTYLYCNEKEYQPNSKYIIDSMKTFQNRASSIQNYRKNINSNFIDFIKASIPLLILIVSFHTLIFTKFETNPNVKSYLSFLKNIILFMISHQEILLILSFLFILLLFLPFFKWCFICKKILHKDYRPKDKYMINLINKERRIFFFLLNFVPAIILLGISIYLFYLKIT